MTIKDTNGTMYNAIKKNNLRLNFTKAHTESIQKFTKHHCKN